MTIAPADAQAGRLNQKRVIPSRGLGPDPATAGLDELLDDREADAGTAARPVARLLDAIEALEDAVEVGRRDAVAGVRDRDEEIGWSTFGTDRDGAAGRRVPGRVRQKVGEDLGELVRVRRVPEAGRADP